uniref:Ig-like domain-containing protein n=1 Tax=Sinocyclocheilus grahami TaxID=75366 RepID=A0A672KE68_SINGR
MTWFLIQSLAEVQHVLHFKRLTKNNSNLLLDPPQHTFVAVSPSGEIVEGDSVTLSCSSDANPPAEISWFKGGKFVGSGRIYSISNISSDHSGEYKCKSINQHGEKVSVTLNVMSFSGKTLEWKKKHGQMVE